MPRRNGAGAGGAEGDDVDHQRFLPIDAARAERLLSGSLDDDHPVGRLLAAAAGPTRPEEIAGEAAAVMAFHGARRAAMPAAPVTHRPRRRTGRALIPIAAGVAAAVAAAGIALAAGTGVLPGPWVNVDSPDPQAPATVITGGATTDAQSSSSGATASGGASVPSASTTPSIEDLIGLCHSYQTRNDKDPGKSMDSNAMARLTAAAGGEERIAAFCEALVGQPAPSGTPSPAG
jgi:hypothetical protein